MFKMNHTITFNKTGYEPFIDFIKAYAIVCVLIGHTFPYLKASGYSLWYGMQVPLFVLVQVFHGLKKEHYSFSIKKIIKRIVFPFLFIQLIPLGYEIFKFGNTNKTIINWLIGGGYGPGSYFPWIYIQLAVLLVYIKPWLDKGSKTKNLIAMLLICEGLEILSSILGFPDWLYRLLSFRYFFLIYLGWLWVKEGIVLNVKTIVLSLLSMGAIIYFDYYYRPTEPWFYDTAWRFQRWPCYFYVSTLLCGGLYWIYNKTKGYSTIGYVSKTLAKCSYEIFLLQMVIIPMMPQLDFIKNKTVCYGFRTALIFIISIVGGYYVNRFYNKICA